MSRLIREHHGVSGVEAFRGRGFIVVPQDGRSLNLPESCLVGGAGATLTS
jgi:hypothetical protein